MSRRSTDEIAREAARLLAAGRVVDVGEAIRAAAAALGLGGAPRPGHGRVRRHLQGLTLQSQGQVAYDAHVRAILEATEEVMTALETALPDAEPRLMGRGARGELDGSTALYVRVHTRAPVSEIAAGLETFGYDEYTFETADTRFGRLDRIRLVEPDGTFVITRCLPEMLWKANTDLFKKRPVESMTLEELRERLGEGGGAKGLKA
jgi:hypothetical protein